MVSMIALATDFGSTGPYMGQVRARLSEMVPSCPVIDLFTDLPVFDPRLSAYVLAAHVSVFPAGCIIVGVVDPGVGSDRAGVAAQVDGRWLVGPDNGLFAPLIRRARERRAWRLPDPEDGVVAPTFHGRDVFAPAAAQLVRHGLNAVTAWTPLDPDALDRTGWPDDLAEIVYIDGYGNAMTGARAASLSHVTGITLDGRWIPRARAFHEVPMGAPLLYENANGLLEIAVNQGRADETLSLGLGRKFDFVTDG